MNCPNCKAEFTKEQGGKHYCPTCESWFEQTGDEWRPCEPAAPALPVEDDPGAAETSQPQNEPENEEAESDGPDDPLDLAKPTSNAEPKPKPKVRSFFGGRFTITEGADYE